MTRPDSDTPTAAVFVLELVPLYRSLKIPPLVPEDCQLAEIILFWRIVIIMLISIFTYIQYL